MLDRLNYCCNIVSAILDGAYGWVDEAIAIAVVVVLFNFFAKRGLFSLHRYFERTNQIWKDGFVLALYPPMSSYVWFFAIFHTLDLISHRVFEGTFLANMHLVLTLGLIIAIAWFLMSWKRVIVRYVHSTRNKNPNALEPGKIDVIDKVATMCIIFLTILFSLEITGQNINTLIAFGGVGGLAIAFASQEMISNFFGGILIYVTHPFAIGDWINLPVHHIEGHVEEIGWYMTRIRTFEKRPIYIPNSMFSKVLVMTPSRMSHRKFDQKIGIRYEDFPAIRAITNDIKTMLQTHFNVDPKQHILVHLENFGSYTVDIHVEAYLIDITPEGYAESKQDLLFRIYDILGKHGAEMPFPTSRQLMSQI